MSDRQPKVRRPCAFFCPQRAVRPALGALAALFLGVSAVCVILFVPYLPWRDQIHVGIWIAAAVVAAGIIPAAIMPRARWRVALPTAVLAWLLLSAVVFSRPHPMVHLVAPLKPSFLADPYAYKRFTLSCLAAGAGVALASISLLRPGLHLLRRLGIVGGDIALIVVAHAFVEIMKHVGYWNY